MSKFIHLHTHSHYSLLNALPKIPELVDMAKKHEMKALALTDNGNLYGAIDFYKECLKNNIKPIIGLHAYVALRKRTDKQAGIDNKRTRLILLAKDSVGYKNLVKLVTASHLEGFYYKPRIDRELLEKHKEGLICISPYLGGDIAQAAFYDDFEKTKELTSWYKNLFGSDFFIEITHHPKMDKDKEKRNLIKKVSEETGVPLTASQEVYYLKPEDKKTRKVMIAIQTNNTDYSVGDLNDEEDFSFISQEKAEDYFKDLPEALENNLKIADRCNLELELGKWVFPNFKLPEKSGSYDEALRKEVYLGIEKRGVEKTEEVEKRIEYELEIIKNKGYAVYFLIVGDLIKYAHKNNILTTIRGSVAGSLVTYLAGITNVDPLEYKLPFERFLNPERPSAPDIDMDFADNRRDEVIAYAREKYGKDKVAQIGTFGTMMARGAVRDVARALNYPYGLGDRIAKLIPFGAQGFPMTIDKALSEVPELLEIYEKEKEVKEIIDTAKKIEGCARHISVHAAGVVISPSPLTDFVPLQFDPKGEEKVITQFDMHAVEEAGLIKFDFLGIKNLSILSESVKAVEKIYGKKIDIENIPLDDKKTFEILAKGETVGLFQLNGSGMTRYLKELKPSRIQDINAMVALYRPGPLESIPSYIERKHNSHLIKYLDPRMEKILDQSYGVITYQDDVMMIAIELAGYSWLEADKLRKAMGKKIPEEMKAQKKKLKQGLIENGMEKEKAEKLWKLIEPFAAYGFNKAHAASYGKVAYQTAYMKANFPAVYMASVLTADSGDVDKIAEIIAECKRMEIPVLPPDINESLGGFTVVEEDGPKAPGVLGQDPKAPGVLGQDPKASSAPSQEKIRFGLYTIKNFGQGIADIIISERKERGKFKSLMDFFERVKDRNLNKKSLEALIKSGAMDNLGERGQMLFNLENILAYNKERNSAPKNQDSLFGLMEDQKSVPELRLEEAAPASQEEKLIWEKELLGLYISGHPMEKFKDRLEKNKRTISDIKKDSKEGAQAVLGGIIEEVKGVTTKKGDRMVFVKLGDLSDHIEMVVFPRVLEEYKEIFETGKCIAVKGRVSNRNDEVSLVVEKVKLLT